MTEAILSWIYNLPISQLIRISPGLFLAIRILHFVAMMFVVVSISKVDLRLMGLAEKRTPVTELLAEFFALDLEGVPYSRNYRNTYVHVEGA